MKATGVVRRIDDLGRVVIPKEIRRTLRIREGDPLEIFTERDGGVILRKYSPIGELSDFSKEYSESLHKVIGNMVFITDQDEFISACGNGRGDYINRKVSSELEGVMHGRKTVILNGKNKKAIPLRYDDDESVNERYCSQVIAPIIAAGDSIGTIIIASSNEDASELGEVELKLAETAANFLGKQMEH